MLGGNWKYNPFAMIDINMDIYSTDGPENRVRVIVHGAPASVQCTPYTTLYTVHCTLHTDVKYTVPYTPYTIW